MPYVWTLSLIMCVLMEAATAALTAIWFMPAGFICLILSLFDVPVPVQIAVYLVVSIATLVVAKYFIHKRGSKQDITPTNADRMIGQTAVVTVAIDNLVPSGEVMVGGQVWTARTADGQTANPGDHVVVERIEGVKLIVRPK